MTDLELLIADAAGEPAARRAVVVRADDGATVGQLARSLGLPRLVLAGHPIDPALAVQDAGLLTGSTLGAPAGPEPVPDGGLELAVVSGPAAGPAVPLRDEVVIGRDRGPGLRLDDPEVSRRHAVVAPSGAGAVVTDTGSRNGTVVDGVRLAAPAELVEGDVLVVGESVLALRRRMVARQRVEPDPRPGRLRWNRPPRLLPPELLVERTVPALPEEPQGRRIPLVMAVIPLVLGLALYLLVDLPLWSLAFLVLSPVVLVASAVSDTRSGRKQYRADLVKHRQSLVELDRELAGLVGVEERARRDAFPDPALVLDLAGGPGARLWERRPADADFLRLRVGLVDAPSRMLLTPDSRGRAKTEYAQPTCRLVPAEVDLAAAGVVGLAGERTALLRLTRSVLAGVAALHAPRDLSLVVLTGTDDAPDWEWAAWLPHTEPPPGGDAPARLVATDGAQATARVAELRRLVEERTEEQRSNLLGGAARGRRVLVVLDGARRLRAVPGLPELLRDGPAVGVVALCLDADEGSLPDECRAVVAVTSRSGTRLTVRLPGGSPLVDVLADGLAPEAALRLARDLAPLRALGGGGGGAADLPDRVRLLDLLPCGSALGPADVTASWRASPGGRSTTALLGTGPDGPVTVDLRRDGPHALIAGTSGSGKSELLQTLVASLALGNTPESLALVLVDYKGGAAFAACARLPHVAGMVTDLDGSLVDRALTSLEAELKRRERVLAAAGAKDLDDHLARGGTDLPRLVLLVDEFASLVEEVPDFVQGVVGIGMRGRSLGVHVVLATQRPAGVVSAEIRANVNLRICLRVTSPGESTDVVDVPDAARLPRSLPGRAYLRTGHSDLLAIQAARVGWPRPELTDTTREPCVVVRERRTTELGVPVPVEQLGGSGDGSTVTDLSVLVDAVRAAAKAGGHGAPDSPWLPPLPEVIDLATCGAPDDHASPVAAVLGRADRPAQQAQPPFVLDLERTGSVVVAGAVRTGRTTVLRTLAAGLARRNRAEALHLYVLDCGARGLAPLAALPHCGAVVNGDDRQRVERLLALLDREIRERQRLLAASGLGSLAELRAAEPDTAPAALVLLLDRLEVFSARYADLDGGRLLEALEALLREGPAAGLTTVLTTDRSGFSSRLAGTVEARLVLRQADRDDAAVYGVPARDLPVRMPDGRGLWVQTGEQVQVAVLAGDPSGGGQAAALTALAATLAPAPARGRPRRVDPLPETVTVAEVEALRLLPAPVGGAVTTVAVGGDELTPCDLDLDDVGGCFTIAGPSRSGRSTALAVAVCALRGRRDGSLPVVVLAPRAGPVRDLAGTPGVLAVLHGDDPAELADLLSAQPGPVALAIDDAELLGEGPLSTLLEARIRAARDGAGPVLCAATTDELLLSRYRGWLPSARRNRTGLLLAPTSATDGEVFDLRLPRSTAGPWPRGRGLLVLRGEALPVQVPAPDLP